LNRAAKAANVARKARNASRAGRGVKTSKVNKKKGNGAQIPIEEVEVGERARQFQPTCLDPCCGPNTRSPHSLPAPTWHPLLKADWIRVTLSQI